MLRTRSQSRSISTAGPATSLVEAHGLGVHRDGRWLVRDIDLTVNRGEIVTLIGPNGSGKSTTAKAIIGVIKPDVGSIRRASGLRIGYVPQALSIDRTLPLTVHRLLTLTARHDRTAVEGALEAVGVPHLRRVPVHDLSGGEFQRALLARALLRAPDLLVLDEPVQGVDFPGELALYGLIQDIRDRHGCGVLLISHDLHVVMAATDTVICLNGSVSCRGSPQAVVADPAYASLFGAAAAETLAVYRHRHGGGPAGHAHDHDHDHDHDHHRDP
ncbi:ATP-binding cassette domain-containing protein [Roseospira visakhapatnamensis]|uniref:Zinc transport system ATP-binding protein n=1 Tax=Roseospira visakhapatnamensis TaxID=390880 RepID=A0A7W6RAK2_9PROT|nr:metal ABC transporter ATP-binding protein [Roseospira visakhapatnamensis]MBB4264855.1 zinc transport system ATP-binding protein [Roseospira visakhapatnamensis]